MIIDCLGDEPKRGLNADAIRQGQVLMASCPWNFASQRFYNVNNMLHDFKGMLDRSDHNKMRRVLFFCKKGERRSAAVLMVVLCQIFHFSRKAAKYQIEEMRPPAAITMVPDGKFPASWIEVNEILDAIDSSGLI